MVTYRMRAHVWRSVRAGPRMCTWVVVERPSEARTVIGLLVPPRTLSEHQCPAVMIRPVEVLLAVLAILAGAGQVLVGHPGPGVCVLALPVRE